MLEEALAKAKSDRKYLEKKKSLKKFCKKFKTFSGKTIDEFSEEELKEQAAIIKEFLGRHDKIEKFFYATQNIKPDAVPVSYI